MDVVVAPYTDLAFVPRGASSAPISFDDTAAAQMVDPSAEKEEAQSRKSANDMLNTYAWLSNATESKLPEGPLLMKVAVNADAEQDDGGGREKRSRLSVNQTEATKRQWWERPENYFASMCWDCKYGQLAKRKNSTIQCRVILRHTDPDYAEDGRGNPAAGEMTGSGGGRNFNTKQRRSTTGEGLVGREVLKQFQQGYFRGAVTRFDARSGFFLILYEDGDSEEMNLEELAEVLQPTRAPRGRKATPGRGAHGGADPLPGGRPADLASRPKARIRRRLWSPRARRSQRAFARAPDSPWAGQDATEPDGGAEREGREQGRR